MTESDESRDERDALLEIARQLEALPERMARATRARRSAAEQLFGTTTIGGRIFTDPKEARERKQFEHDMQTGKRAAVRANIALGLAAVAAIASLIGALT